MGEWVNRVKGPELPIHRFTNSPNETRNLAVEFARSLTQGSVVGLIGDLGAGKTTFVQGMAKGLGIDPKYYVNSPTFTLINEYPGLIHVDLYRIEKEVDFQTLGLDDYLRQNNIIVIEWVEKLPSLMKQIDLRVQIESVSEKERKIEIDDL